MTFGRCGMAALLALAVLAISADADDDALQAARESVEQTYGQRIAAAADTDTARDDLKLAEELIAAARQTGRPAAEQFALADAAAVLVAPLGTQDSGDVARKAMVLAESIMPYSPAIAALRRWQIESGRLARLQRRHGDLDVVVPVAGASARAGLAYVEALLAEPDDTAQASQALREVRNLVNRYKLKDLSPRMQAAEERIRWVAVRDKRLADARLMLRRAQDKDNQRAVVAARRELADAYITFDGDLLTAADYIDGTGHALEQAVKVVAAVHAGQRPDEREEIIEAVVALRDCMANLDEPAFSRVGEHAITLCQAYQAGATDGPQRVTGRLYRMQIDRLLGRSPADVMLAELSEAYDGPLHCRLQALDDQRVRISYDFEDPQQLDDWTYRQSGWRVAGALVQAGGSASTPIGITTRLRFRADRPVRATLRARAFDEIGVLFAFGKWGQGSVSAAYQVYFRGPQHGGRRARRLSGLQLITPRGGHSWADESRLLTSGTAYDIELVIDGAGGVTWWINDVLVHEYHPAPGETVETDGYVVLELVARGASSTNPTGYDDVVIEGHVLPDPNWRPGGGD